MLLEVGWHWGQRQDGPAGEGIAELGQGGLDG